MQTKLLLDGLSQTDPISWAKARLDVFSGGGLSFEPDSFTPCLAPNDAHDFACWIAAALLADWLTYAQEEDRADFARLEKVMRSFPEGFCVWFARSGDVYWPVGYTGWYPLSGAAFAVCEDAPQTLRHRGELAPALEGGSAARFVWLFNYSVLPPFRGAAQSRAMLQAYAKAIHAQKPRGLAATVLSEGGRRVARRFGMALSGQMTHQGVSEEVWTGRL